MTSLSIKQRWIDTDAEGEASTTLARLQIQVGKTSVTENRIVGHQKETFIEIPTYYLAEWIAENWWVVLNEPRKDDDADDTAYFARHSIVSAQGGFPLPKLTIVPVGRGIHLHCAPKVSVFAKVKFTAGAFASLPRPTVETQLHRFVEEVVARLRSRGRIDTSLGQIWAAILSLTPEEKTLCNFLGSLGVAPSDATDELVTSVETMLTALGERATRDFCLAASPDEMEASQTYLDAVSRTLAKAPEAALDPLLKAELPPENYQRESWRRGKLAAERVRSILGVGVQNANAADILFERMKVDPSRRTSIENSPPFAGAVHRSNGTANIALLQAELAARRFSAARAGYLAWVSEAQSQRLVTNAVTRDQQASRSFAAEILVPQAYLLSVAGPKRVLHIEQIHEASRARRVMPDVVSKQAVNAEIKIVRH